MESPLTQSTLIEKTDEYVATVEEWKKYSSYFADDVDWFKSIICVNKEQKMRKNANRSRSRGNKSGRPKSHSRDRSKNYHKSFSHVLSGENSPATSIESPVITPENSLTDQTIGSLSTPIPKTGDTVFTQYTPTETSNNTRKSPPIETPKNISHRPKVVWNAWSQTEEDLTQEPKNLYKSIAPLNKGTKKFFIKSLSVVGSSAPATDKTKTKPNNQSRKRKKKRNRKSNSSLSTKSPDNRYNRRNKKNENQGWLSVGNTKTSRRNR